MKVTKGFGKKKFRIYFKASILERRLIILQVIYTHHANVFTLGTANYSDTQIQE